MQETKRYLFHVQLRAMQNSLIVKMAFQTATNTLRSQSQSLLTLSLTPMINGLTMGYSTLIFIFMGYLYFHLFTNNVHIVYILLLFMGKATNQTTYISYLQFQLSNYIISFKFQLFYQLFYYIIPTSIILIFVKSYFSNIIIMANQIIYLPTLIIHQHIKHYIISIVYQLTNNMLPI